MSIGGIGGYNAFAQPLIQERAANQQRAVPQDDSSKGSSSVSKREEVFRSLLTASSPLEESGKEGSAEKGASSFRGKLVDISV